MIVWPLESSFYPNLGASGQDLDFTHRFEPENGPAIERPSTTARMQQWSMSFVLSNEERAILDAWWSETLVRGTLPFFWRHPLSHQVTRWKIRGGLRYSTLTSHVQSLELEAMLMPGTPWFASYVPEPFMRAPLWVADYVAGIYGVDGARGVAADLSGVSGTYEVWRRKVDGSQSFFSQTYSGDIPLTAPTGVASLVGFAL